MGEELVLQSSRRKGPRGGVEGGSGGGCSVGAGPGHPTLLGASPSAHSLSGVHVSLP